MKYETQLLIYTNFTKKSIKVTNPMWKQSNIILSISQQSFLFSYDPWWKRERKQIFHCIISMPMISKYIPIFWYASLRSVVLYPCFVSWTRYIMLFLQPKLMIPPSLPNFCKVNVFKPAYVIGLVGTVYFRYNQIVELANYNQIVKLELE